MLQGHDVVDAEPAGVPHVGAYQFNEAVITLFPQRGGIKGRQAPILPGRIINVRGTADLRTRYDRRCIRPRLGSGEESFSRAYTRFAGEAASFVQIVRDAKLRIMDHEIASELNVLARDASRIARQNPRTADFTHNILHRALREIVACFPVYRTYVDAEGPPTVTDRRDLEWAISQARRNETNLDPSVFDFAYRRLSGDLAGCGKSRDFGKTVMKRARKGNPDLMKSMRYEGAKATNWAGSTTDRLFPQPARLAGCGKSRRAAFLRQSGSVGISVTH